jgi:hypothetical protein
MRRALVHHDRGDLPRAIEDYTRTIDLGARDPQAFMNRGEGRESVNCGNRP